MGGCCEEEYSIKTTNLHHPYCAGWLSIQNYVSCWLLRHRISCICFMPARHTVDFLYFMGFYDRTCGYKGLFGQSSDFHGGDKMLFSSYRDPQSLIYSNKEEGFEDLMVSDGYVGLGDHRAKKCWKRVGFQVSYFQL